MAGLYQVFEHIPDLEPGKETRLLADKEPNFSDLMVSRSVFTVKGINEQPKEPLRAGNTLSGRLRLPGLCHQAAFDLALKGYFQLQGGHGRVVCDPQDTGGLRDPFILCINLIQEGDLRACFLPCPL